MKFYKNASVLFALLVVICALTVKTQGQTAPDESKKINGGVLNGKAISLPKPTYPETAKAANASGVVAVQITIDEGGNVISANAVSGHPLLRAAAVESAYQARFSPTTLNGQPVKVTGSLSYNFVNDDEKKAVTFTGGPSEGRLNTGSKAISGGVLNGKAISLPKPAYPPIAKAARASGTVVVQVTIDEEGNVISANAISGHPLLKAAAVQAAIGARFAPTLLQGQPVKVTGTINYNFLLPMSWIQIGDELGKAERTVWPPSPSVAANLPAQEFELEIQELHALSNAQTKSTDAVKISISKEAYTQRISSIISSLQGKLGSGSVRDWYFSLGLLIGRAKESISSESGLRETLESLRLHSINAPLGVDSSVSSRLQQLVSYANKTELDNADKEKIKSLLFSVLSTPIEKE